MGVVRVKVMAKGHVLPFAVVWKHFLEELRTLPAELSTCAGDLPVSQRLEQNSSSVQKAGHQSSLEGTSLKLVMNI